jgi:putative transposase
MNGALDRWITLRITIEQHKIQLTDDEPYAQRYRPQSHANCLKNEKQCKALLDEKKLIHKLTSPYASNVTLAPKSDGTKRLCINYNALNKKNVYDKQPIPRVSEIIYVLKKANYFLKINCKKGYCHIEMEPEDIQKTAFITKDNLYEWVVNGSQECTRQILKSDSPDFQRFII